MKSFSDFLAEKAAGGQTKGKLEIAKIDVKTARNYSEKVFAMFNRNFEEEHPDFDKHFGIAKYKALLGHTQRKDMPVIESDDLKALQSAFKEGSIDRRNPFSSFTNSSDPFPEGLSGEEASRFMLNGLERFDGSKPDDRVKFKTASVAVKNLVPIQRQIYFDKAIDPQAKFGIKKSKQFIMQARFITSSDFSIIDGHHRFISALLIDPDMKVNLVMVDLPIAELLPLTLAFGDARGNKRNA